MNEHDTRNEPLLGAHMSISGGLEKALVRGHALGCNTIQMFTGNSNRWDRRPLERSKIDLFRQKRIETGIHPVISHASYLINLASPDEDLYKKSVNAMLEELSACEQLGIEYLVVHPGFHKGHGEKYGTDRIISALDTLHADTEGFRVKIALETTAGQGTVLGCRFEQIARIIDGVKENSRLSFCLDTCHIFAAGYDLRTEKDYNDLFRKVESTIGIRNLKVLHLNDSMKERGSRVDRHENIGKGMIGEQIFRLIMRDEALKEIPKIIETPGDIENLTLLRSFA